MSFFISFTYRKLPLHALNKFIVNDERVLSTSLNFARQIPLVPNKKKEFDKSWNESLSPIPHTISCIAWHVHCTLKHLSKVKDDKIKNAYMYVYRLQGKHSQPNTNQYHVRKLFIPSSYLISGDSTGSNNSFFHKPFSYFQLGNTFMTATTWWFPHLHIFLFFLHSTRTVRSSWWRCSTTAVLYIHTLFCCAMYPVYYNKRPSYKIWPSQCK